MVKLLDNDGERTGSFGWLPIMQRANVKRCQCFGQAGIRVIRFGNSGSFEIAVVFSVPLVLIPAVRSLQRFREKASV